MRLALSPILWLLCVFLCVQIVVFCSCWVQHTIYVLYVMILNYILKYLAFLILVLVLSVIERSVWKSLFWLWICLFLLVIFPFLYFYYIFWVYVYVHTDLSFLYIPGKLILFTIIKGFPLLILVKLFTDISRDIYSFNVFMVFIFPSFYFQLFSIWFRHVFVYGM